MNNLYHYYYHKLIYKRRHRCLYRIINNVLDTESDKLDDESILSESYMKRIDDLCNVKLECSYAVNNTRTHNLLTLLHLRSKVCCLCGVEQNKHHHKPHKFVEKNPKYKCRKCKKYFYEHDHYNNPCFDPYVRL